MVQCHYYDAAVSNIEIYFLVTMLHKTNAKNKLNKMNG